MSPESRPGLVLIVDDDEHIRQVVRFALEKEGYRTTEAGDGKQAIQSFGQSTPDLIILDILMPEMDGTEVCRQLRKSSSVPIIFLSSKDEEVDRILGLELGGDDYLTKPFSPRELIARVRAVLRRTQTPIEPRSSEEPSELRHGQLRLDLNTYQAFWGKAEIILTATEFGILRTLMGYPGRVYSREELLEGAWSEPTVVTDRTIDTHIRRIRKKYSAAEESPIETVHRIGYKLGPCG